MKKFSVPAKMSSSQGQKLKAKKTSTPEKDTNETLLCDLSMITRPLDLSTASKKDLNPVTTAPKNTRTSTRTSLKIGHATQAECKPKPATKKNEVYTEEDMVTAVTNANLQSQLMKFLVEKCTYQMQKDLDEDLYRLQKEIEREQTREKELKYRRKTIIINKEIEKCLDANEKPIENLVENLKAGNVAQNLISKCDAITKELEKNEDKIVCININIPENDSSNEKLQSMIGETKEAYEELTSELEKLQIDEKVVEALDKTLKLTEGFAERQKRCEEGLKELQTLTARENTLGIMVALEEKMKNHSTVLTFNIFV